jgi:hypothetical protein
VSETVRCLDGGGRDVVDMLTAGRRVEDVGWQKNHNNKEAFGLSISFGDFLPR